MRTTACPRRSLLERIESPAPSLWRLALDEVRVAALYGLLGEFCHAFRNRMNSLQLCLYLDGSEAEDELDESAAATSQPAATGRTAERDAAYRSLLAVVDRLQEVCRPVRHDPTSLPFSLLLMDLLASWRRVHGLDVDAIVVRPGVAPEVEVRDAMRLAHGLDGLAAWRLRPGIGRAPLTIEWRLTRGRLLLEWSEGPGRGEGQGADPARGVLPLALLARLATAHGGHLDVVHAPTFRVRLSWPIEIEPDSAPAPRQGGPSPGAMAWNPRLAAGRP
jgi:hypothetical protein